jgi:MATE family multidrug resistance protein
MMGWFGAEAISANQVGNTYGNCTFMMVLSLGSATTICVSHAFGRRSIDEIASVVRSALAMAVIWGTTVIVAFVTLRHVMPLLFTQNAEVIVLASQMLVLYATYQLSDAVQCVFVAILRGLQQVRSIAIISFIAYIVINIPVGYFVAFHLGVGATGLVVGYIVGLSVAAILYGIQAYRYMRYLRKIS